MLSLFNWPPVFTTFSVHHCYFPLLSTWVCICVCDRYELLFQLIMHLPISVTLCRKQTENLAAVAAAGWERGSFYWSADTEAQRFPDPTLWFLCFQFLLLLLLYQHWCGFTETLFRQILPWCKWYTGVVMSLFACNMSHVVSMGVGLGFSILVETTYWLSCVIHLFILAHLCLVLAGPAHHLCSSVPDHQINAWNFDNSACPLLGPLTTLWIESVITLQIVQNATARKANITPVFNDTSLAARCLRRKCKILLLKVVMAAGYKVELVSSYQLQILRRERANQPQTQKVFAVLSCMPCFNWYTHYCNHLFLECNLF